MRVRRSMNLIFCMFLLAFALPVGAATEPPVVQGLVEQIAHLAESCQNGQDLTAEQLQELISRSDYLLEAVQKSDHSQRKLLVFRLKKSRNLCRYLLQLKQRD